MLVSEVVRQMAIPLGVEDYDGCQGFQAPPLVNARRRPDGFLSNHQVGHHAVTTYHNLPQP